MNEPRLNWLLEHYVSGQCTPAEKKELSLLLLDRQEEPAIQAWMERYWHQVQTEPAMTPAAAKLMADNILQTGGLTKVVPLKNTGKIFWRRFAVAASILLLLGVGGWLLLKQQPEGGKQQVTPVVATIAAPDRNRAAITLADGSTVYLDSVHIGQHLTQGDAKILKTADGKLVYSSDATAQATVAYNTLTNPRGSKVIDLALADGSHVWLNAGSSIRYPVVFAGKERAVTVTGEAYFEVTHDKSKPFKVNKGDLAVEVLGTHFNVNAYDDEPDVRVTLLEGSVRLTRNAERITLKPGQQGIAFTHSPLTTDNSPDLDQVMAWRNGLFSFSRTSLPAVMRQLARWYDVQIEYKGTVPNLTFGGEMERDLSLLQVLKLLEKSGVHYTVEAVAGGSQKIVVLP